MNRPLPTALTLHQKSRYLELAYDDGSRFQLPCEYLRVYSPSAEVRGHLPGEAKLQVGKEQVNITELKQIGNYAVKIFFDDGHKSGLYDWQYLYRLGQSWRSQWDDYLRRLDAAGHQRNGPDPFEGLSQHFNTPS